MKQLDHLIKSGVKLSRVDPSWSGTVNARWLAIEGAETSCSVAVSGGENGVVNQLSYEQPRGHAEWLPQMIDGLMQWAEVDPTQLAGVVISNGPGAFTGLRISVALAQGLAYGWGVPVIPVSSLATSAFSVLRDNSPATLAHDVSPQNASPQVVCAAFDARMGEVYSGLYVWDVQSGSSNHALRALVADCVALPGALFAKCHEAFTANPEITASVSEVIVTGSGFDGAEREVLSQLGDAFGAPLTHRCSSLDAVSVLSLAMTQTSGLETIDPVTLGPTYLRHAIAEPPKRLTL